MAGDTSVRFQSVDIIFGERPDAALTLLDQGIGRDEILEQTDQVVGVADATLSVDSGEICVLMGLSGSGKSTLVRAVNGLNRPARGQVLVQADGEEIDVVACDQATLRRLRMHHIAMVFQQFALFPWRTVAENVGFGLELAGVAAAERAERVDRQLDLVHLGQWRDKYAHELSGGMQQRVGLARAFATDAPILLMDEPFSALDPLIRTHLQDELLELQKTLKCTIIFVSHDLDEAIRIGSRIAIMEAGRVVQYGLPREIVLDPATDYVAEFVAHMNPLSVLHAGDMMAPVADGDAMPRDADGQPLVTAAVADAGAGTVALASPETPMQVLIKARMATGRPVLVTDGERIQGVVGDAELYGALVKK